MGFEVESVPATFYVWLDLSALPQPLDSGLVLFEELLKEKVIVVPGQFFDLREWSPLRDAVELRLTSPPRSVDPSHRCVSCARTSHPISY